ncbi:MAG: S8 family serine peptidase [Dokdonella sp.]
MNSNSLRPRRLALQISVAFSLAACLPAFAADVASIVRATAQQSGKADVLIAMSAQAPRQLLRTEGNYIERRTALVELLRSTADVSQADIRQWLDAQGISYRSYWINNTLQAELTSDQIEALAGRSDVARIVGNNPIRQKLIEDNVPSTSITPDSIQAITYGVAKVRAPDVWALGFTGQGVVIAGQDTGIRWTHVAIKQKYRGWNATAGTVDHNYNWHDSIHAPQSGGSCGPDQIAPCDDNNHGTHTIGTMVGDDGAAEQIGVAPGAKWIGCRNMNAGDGRPASYNECGQWLLAPTDLAGQNPRPDLAPDVVSNSWGCPASEECTAGNEVKAAIDALVDGGILFVAAAGNGGSTCGGIIDQPSILDSAFVVGATDSADRLASYSLRGPVPGVTRIRPDLSAPGSAVRSAFKGSDIAYSSISGTSMATPHVAGVAALIMSVNPSLKGNPHRVEEILRSTVTTEGVTSTSGTTQTCGGIPSTTWPNYSLGFGRVNAYEAFLVAEKIMAGSFD